MLTKTPKTQNQMQTGLKLTFRLTVKSSALVQIRILGSDEALIQSLKIGLLSLSLSLSLSQTLRFNSHFPGEPGLAGIY